MPHPPRFGVLYDFRNPSGGGLGTRALYAATLEQIRAVDALGYDHVWLSEHHFTGDGYLPSPLVVSGAIAAVTERVAIAQDILLVPFRHPLRLAEDLAVLDNLSGGRMMLGAGMGYVHAEFDALGIPRRNRVSLLEESLEIVRRAWSEETISFHGRRFRFDDVRVTPRPVQPGGPPVWIASMSEAGARRAARFGAHLLPQGDRAAVLDPWHEALAERGRRPDEFRVGLVRGFFVGDDPERLRAEFLASPAAEAEREVGRIYARWIAESGDRMSEQVRAGAETGRAIPQGFFFGTPEQCAEEIARMGRDYGVTDLILRGVSHGQPPEQATPNLERFAREVVPLLRPAEPV
jgi:probable F420-dependent oxidoreductase